MGGSGSPLPPPVPPLKGKIKVLRTPSPPFDGGGQWSLPSPTLFPSSWSKIYYSSSYSSCSSSSSSPSTSEGYDTRRRGVVEEGTGRKKERERQKEQGERDRKSEKERERDRKRERGIERTKKKDRGKEQEKEREREKGQEERVGRGRSPLHSGQTGSLACIDGE